MAQLRSVNCHMGSHSVTCYPTQVNTPRLNPSHAGRYSISILRSVLQLQCILYVVRSTIGLLKDSYASCYLSEIIFFKFNRYLMTIVSVRTAVDEDYY